MDSISSGGLPCSGAGVSFGPVEPSAVSHQLQRRDPPGPQGARARQQHQGAPPSCGSLPVLSYSPPSGLTSTFVRDVGAYGGAAFSSLSSAGDTLHYRTADGLGHFPGTSVGAEFTTEGVDTFHAVSDGVPLASARSISADASLRGPPDGHRQASAEPSIATPCGVPQEQLGPHGSPGQGGSDEAARASLGPQLPRVCENACGEEAADRPVDVAAAAYHEVPQEQTGVCGPPSMSSGEAGGFGGPLSGIEKYLQWLDAIHTACSKLDDLCSKLDRNFPNATREWDATSAGIRGARQLFKMFADAQPPQQVQHQPHAAGGAHGPPSQQEELFSANPRKRPRRDPANAVGAAAGGLHGAQPAAGGLAHEFAGAAISLAGRAPLQHLQQPPTGTMAAMGLGGGTYGTPVIDPQGKPVGGGLSLSMRMTQQCSSPLPGTANVLPPAGVPATPLLGDGGDYEYLLDYPEQEAPDPDNPSDLKCDVAGVYWDKRSWIASWYEGGKRYYKSFSAKTHGFYRSKYWAIKVRLSKVQSHALASKGCKARATAA